MTRTLPILFALAGCSSSLTADGLGLLDLQFGLTSSQTARAAGVEAFDADGMPILVDGGTLHLERIDFELPAGVACDPALLDAPVRCDLADDPTEGGTVRIVGPIAVDLATGASDPPLEGLTIPAGTYERIDLRLDADAAPDGRSVTAFGTLDDAGTLVPWTLALAIDEDARLEAAGGVTVADATTATVLLDVALWFADLPVSSCLRAGQLATEGTGSVRLDDSAGCDLEDALEDAIGRSGRVDDHGEHHENETENETEDHHGPGHD